MQATNQFNPHFGWHLLFLSRIYSFIGWLGLLGGLFMLLTILEGTTEMIGTPATMFGMPTGIAAFLLIGWCIILLGFSKDIVGKQQWSTGVGGWFLGAFHLISVPIGTTIGLYTLYVLFRCRQYAPFDVNDYIEKPA